MDEGTLPVPTLEHLARVEVEVGDLLDVGATDAGHRVIAHIAGGTVRGPHLAGEVLPGGADWQATLPDGTVRVDTRYTVRTDGGRLVHLRAVGLRTGPDDVLAALTAGEPVDPSSYRYRTTMTFEAGDPDLAWLTRTLGVCSVARRPSSVTIDIYTVT